jgi:hypothetical protein
MAIGPALTTDQNILPVQAYFNLDGSFNTFLGQGQPFVVSATESIGIIDTTVSGTFYPTFSAVNTGQITTLSVTSTKLSFNPSTGVLSSSGFAGPLNGNASTATNLQTGGANTLVYQSSYGNTAYLTNGTTGQVLTATTGSAPSWTTPTFFASVTDDTTTNATRYPLFANQTSGSLTTEYTSSTKYQYNPSTGTLSATVFSGSGANLTSIPNSALTNSSITLGSTAISLGGTATTIAGLTSVTSTTFVGALTGNASTATSATTATNATNTAITDNTSSNSTWYPTIVSTTTGNLPQTTSSTKLSFVPSTGTLSATNFSGLASSATNIAGGVANQIPYQTSAGATSFISAPTISSTYLSWNGSSFAWATAGGSGMVYPGAGIPNSTGSAWGTSYTTTGSGTVVALATSPTLTTPAITGGTIDNTVIGGTTPAAGTFTTITGQTEVLKGTGENLLQQSNTFSNAYWTNTAGTLTGSQSDPFGGSTASLLVPTVTNTNHWLYSGTYGIAANPYTLSIYVKASGYSLVYLSDVGNGTYSCSYNLSAVTATPNTGCTGTITAVTGATGWYRITLTTTTTISTNSRFTITGYPAGATLGVFGASFAGDGTSGIVIYGSQAEFGSTANTYIPTTTTAVYGTPSLSFSGVAGLGLQSDGSLYVSPAGTGALQAQKTDSTTAGGNARGANAVDWQTARASSTSVASGAYSVIGGGQYNASSGYQSVVAGGSANTANNFVTFIGGGQANTASGQISTVAGGGFNTTAGYFNFIGGGYLNSATNGSAVTTQSATMNGTTAVTLSGSNANIKVGQVISGTYMTTYPNYTYVAAISGTSLTLSQVASGSGTATLSFYTPHGVVVGGGNNQATGSYSFIGGGGDAGTAAQRNTASGDWSTVGGGRNNTASGNGAVVSGGGYYNGSSTSVVGNTASADGTFVGGGFTNTASSFGASVVGGYSNTANGTYSAVLGSAFGTARSIQGNTVSPASSNPMNIGTAGVCQSAVLVLARQTTDATATVLCSNSAAASGTNQIILPNNSAYYFKAKIIAGVTGGGNTASWTFEGAIKRGANAGTTTLVGTPVKTLLAQDSGASTWAITATADTSNGGLAITVTGQASTTIRWVCQIETTEMTY